MNTLVNFKIAKLLKEKGFKELSRFGYEIFGDETVHLYQRLRDNNSLTKNLYSAPTIAEVVMWLYEKYGVWVVVNPHKGKDDSGKPFMEFNPEVWSFTNECVFHNTGLFYFNSPTEAYESAIEYCLTNLI